MYAKTLSTMVLIATLGVSPVLAQDQTIDGQPVPSAQMEEVQAKCDELRNAAAADAGAGAAAGAAAGQAAPATPTPSAAEAPAAGASAPAEAEVDVESLTLEMCYDGGFTSSSP